MMRMPALALALVVLAAIQPGCSKRNAGGSATDRPDRSLSETEYARMGLPDIGTAWSPRDLAQAAAKLKALYESDPDALPRYKSARSGRVFDRMTSDENLPPLTGLPSREQGSRISTLLRFNIEMQELYARAVRERHYGEEELTELQIGTNLKITLAATEWVDRGLRSTPTDDPEWSTRATFVNGIKNGLEGAVSDSLDMLSAAEEHAPGMIHRGLELLSQSLPGARRYMEPVAQQLTILQLQKLRSRPGFAPYTGEIDALLSAYESADSGEAERR